MFETVRNAFKIKDLRKKLFYTFFALIVVRIGSQLPVPGVKYEAIREMFNSQKSLDFFNQLTGGSFEQMSIFALNITPYITASIIIQLLTIAIPRLEELHKDGEEGRKKLTEYTRYVTIGLSVLESAAMAIGFGNSGYLTDDKITFTSVSVIIVSLTAGSAFLMWLGEQITERGIGNGISILVFGGIVAGLPHAIIETVEQARQGQMHPLVLLLIAAIVFAVTYFVVFVERGQRRIRVEYAKRQQGRQILGGHSTHLPLKVNMANVMPAIFASSIILFPATLTQWFGQNDKFEWLNDLSMLLNPGQPLYLLVYAVAIIFFSFFYTAMQYNPRDTADNLKKSGAFIPGIRPGEQTSRYIDKVMTRLTLIGGLYVTFVCLVPYIMTSAWDVKFYFGGTSLLIVVVVIMDFIVQVQSHLMSSQYESALKKANLKGFGQ